MSVIIYGPAACGKTRNRDALRAAFHCDHVVDDWQPGDKIARGTLYLTNSRPPDDVARRTRIVPFHIAMDKIAEDAE